MTPDYYELLGVAADADHDTIRAAYLALTKRYQADTATADSWHNAEMLQLVTEGYEILRDPDRRARYDRPYERQKRYLAQRDQFDYGAWEWHQDYGYWYYNGSIRAGEARREDEQRSQEEQEQREAIARAGQPFVSAGPPSQMDSTAVAKRMAGAESRSPSVLHTLLVFSVGAFAGVGLAFGLIRSLVHDIPPAKPDVVANAEKFQRELEQQLAARADDQKALARERTRGQELEQQLAARVDDQKALAQERARSQALEQQLAARRDDQKALVQEQARSQELEKQLAARGDSEKLLAQERARSQGLEQQLAARGDSEKLLAQERARSQGLEQQLAARGDNEKLLVQERARSQELEKQLAARGDSEKLLAQERARSQGLEKQLAARGDNEKLLAQERARSQGLERQLAARGDSEKLLVQERARSQGLERQLAARGDSEKLLVQERARSQELEQQLAARGDSEKLLVQERARSQGLEQQLAARGDNEKLLAQERARSQELEQQLAARRHATPAPGHNAIKSLSDTPHPTPPPATNEPATAPLPRSDKPVIPAVDNAATLAARPAVPGNPEAAGLMARARVLLGQGNIGVARIVLERAADMGSAPALFVLAETYDPAILSAWGTLGTQGDVGKAQELYAKAFASGVREAKDRLNALR